ncbi:MAG: RNA polymerase sigma factor [Oscillospiraceae bacterium]|nr:RNA polymerase sigma factor [Oscillospiraceae bacterium]
MEDREIVDLYWQRSELAISETEQKYGRYCRAIAMNICGTNEDAEECVNDTWFRAWNRMPSERPTVLSAFLGCITRNLAINTIKAKNRIKRGGGETSLALEELSECLSDGRSPETVLEEKELEKRIGRFTADLKETDRMIFVLRYWYLMPVADIAEKLRCSEAKVKSSLFRTRKKLREALQEEGFYWTN